MSILYTKFRHTSILTQFLNQEHADGMHLISWNHFYTHMYACCVHVCPTQDFKKLVAWFGIYMIG